VTFLTDFADQAVILPIVLAVGVALLAQGWRRGAVAWALVIVVTFAAMLALKVLFIACSASLGTGNIRTPSGHVASAAVVAGGLAAVLWRRRSAVLGMAALAAIVIGLSRLALGVHSPAEVMIGAGVGLAGALALPLLAGPTPRGLDGRRVAVIAVAVVVIFHGMHLPAEAHIRSTAWRFANVFAVCQSSDVRL
jgi:membrane-associated phospholipid phosphatase